MMKVGEGKSSSVDGREWIFSEHNVFDCCWLEREREEKSDYRSARAEEGGRRAMCIRIDCDLCIYVWHKHTAATFITTRNPFLLFLFHHLNQLKLYVLPEEAIIYIYIYIFVHWSGQRKGNSVNPTLCITE